jgi:hypothetical protein
MCVDSRQTRNEEEKKRKAIENTIGMLTGLLSQEQCWMQLLVWEWAVVLDTSQWSAAPQRLPAIPQDLTSAATAAAPA